MESLEPVAWILGWGVLLLILGAVATVAGLVFYGAILLAWGKLGRYLRWIPMSGMVAFDQRSDRQTQAMRLVPVGHKYGLVLMRRIKIQKGESQCR